MQKEKRKSTLIANLALLLVSTIACVAVAEIGIRLVAPQDLEPHPRGLYQSDPDLGWRLTPLFSGVDQSSEFQIDVDINALGMRGPVPLHRSPTEQRLLVVGDSFTYGTGVNARDTYPVRVEEQLREQGNRDIRVFNAGVPGYGTNRQLMLFEQIREEINPDIVLVGLFLGNDFFDNINLNNAEVVGGYLTTTALGTRAQLTEMLGLPVEFKIWMRTRSHLYAVLMKAWTAILARKGETFTNSALEIYLNKDTERVSAAVTETRELLRRFAEKCRDEGIAFGLVLIPNGWLSTNLDTRSEYNLARPTERARQIATELGIPFLDLYDSLGTVESYELYYPLDGHWTAEGHAAAARAISASLLDGELRPLLGRE